MTTRELARVGYEAYGDAADWLNFQGDEMPEWDNLPEHIRKKWEAATSAIVKTAHQLWLDAQR